MSEEIKQVTASTQAPVDTQAVELDMLKAQVAKYEALLKASNAPANQAAPATPAAKSVEDVHREVLAEKEKDQAIRNNVRLEFELESELDGMIKDMSSPELEEVNKRSKDAGVAIADRHKSINDLALKQLRSKFMENKIISAAIADATSYAKAKDMIQRLNSAMPAAAAFNENKKPIGDLSHLIVRQKPISGRSKAS
jgi:hypothetical protein